MSNAQWGKTWYQAPTEISRNGKTWHFALSQQEIDQYGKANVIEACKAEQVHYRFVWTRNSEYELWTDEDCSMRIHNQCRASQ